MNGIKDKIKWKVNCCLTVLLFPKKIAESIYDGDHQQKQYELDDGRILKECQHRYDQQAGGCDQRRMQLLKPGADQCEHKEDDHQTAQDHHVRHVQIVDQKDDLNDDVDHGRNDDAPSEDLKRRPFF